MKEIQTERLDEVAGGIQFAGGFGYGRIPGFGSDGGPYGLTYERSFSNGWSLSAGFARGGDRGFELRYAW